MKAEVGAGIEIDVSQIYIHFLVILGIIILSLLISSIISSGIAALTCEHLKGKARLTNCIKTAVERAPYVLAAALLYFLALMGIFAIVLLAVFSFACLIFLMLIAVILAIYVGLRLLFYLYPVVLFKRGPIEALGESWEITKGKLLQVLAILLILVLLNLPILMLQFLSMSNIFISVAILFFSSTMKMFGVSVMTLAYLQLAGRYGRYGFINAENEGAPNPALRKAIILIGFGYEEIRNMGDLGYPVHSISESALYAPLSEIIRSPKAYEGDGRWSVRKFVIFHGIDGKSINSLTRRISEKHRKIVFAATTETSMDWTLKYLLKQLGRDGDYKNKSREKRHPQE